MTQESTANLTLDDLSVLEYLQADPAFFTRHPTFLSELKLPNPHGEGVISLSTRQVGLLRAQLEEKSGLLKALIANGKANDAINAQIHQLSLQLLRDSDIDALHSTLDTYIKQTFDLTYANLLQLDNTPALPVAFTNWLQAQTKPFCNKANAAINTLIESQILASSHGSFSVIPMFAAETKNVVACILLAAKDTQHFTPDMETDFLTRIGELFSARLISLDKA